MNSSAPAEFTGRGARGFLPRIETLRGFAALAVAWGHSGAIMNLASGNSNAAGPYALRSLLHLSFWAMNGSAAVILFFVISGLVLGLMLDGTGSAAISPRRYAAFLVRRVSRLYPAHWAALIIFLPLAWGFLFRSPVADPAFLAAQPPSLRWWFDGTIFGHIYPRLLAGTAALYYQFYNGVVWSLRVEMQACLVLPLLVWVTRHRRLYLDLGVLAALIAIAALVDTSVRPDAVFLYLPAFHLGAMAGTHGPAITTKLAGRRGATLAALILSYTVFAVPTALVRSPDVHLLLVLDISLGAFGMVVLIAWANLGYLDWLFLNRASRSVGRLSYSFYLWHWLVLVATVRALLVLTPGPVLVGPLNIPLFLTVAGFTIITALGIAALSYRWIERPFIAVGRTLAMRVQGDHNRNRGAASAASV